MIGLKRFNFGFITLFLFSLFADAVELGRPIFFEAEVDKSKVFVQQQVILITKLYKEKSLPGVEFTGPLIDNAILEKVAEDKLYTVKRNKRKYIVRERRYAIFPQKSGSIKIVNRLTAPNDLTIKRHTPQSWAYDGDLEPSKFEKILFLDVAPQVKFPKPATNDSEDFWLPTSKLLVDESGIDSKTIWRVGKPVQWYINLTAHGLSENQLPEVKLPNSTKIRFYLEEDKRERSTNLQGVIGMRKFRFAIVPSNVGEVTLPEIEITWWNTTTGKMEHSKIKSRKIAVVK